MTCASREYLANGHDLTATQPKKMHTVKHPRGWQRFHRKTERQPSRYPSIKPSNEETNCQGTSPPAAWKSIQILAFFFFGSDFIHEKGFSVFSGLIVFNFSNLANLRNSRFRNIGLMQLILAMIPCSSNSKIGSGHRSSPVSGARLWNGPQNSFTWYYLGVRKLQVNWYLCCNPMCFFLVKKRGWPRWRDAKTEGFCVEFTWTLLLVVGR